MPVGWNDTFDENTDLFSAAFYNMFVNAINERLYTATSPLALVTTTTDAQDLARILVLQNTFRTKICSSGPNDASGFIRINTAVDGRTYTTVAETGVQASLLMQNWVWQLSVNSDPYDYNTAYLGGLGWTRKYTREFAVAGSTTYLDGSAFVNGQIARRGDNGFVYTRTAGAWVLSPTAFPDIVTNYGFAQAGDLIGVWLYTELRDALNRMVWRKARATTFLTGKNKRTLLTGDDVGATWAAAMPVAEAAWTAGPAVVSDPYNFYDASGYTEGWGTHASMRSSIAQADVSTASSEPNGVGRNPHAQFEFYTFLDTSNNATTGRLGGSGEFDANGMTEGYRIWRKFSTTAQTGATTRSSAFGNNAKPNWCPAPTVPVPDPTQGWQAGWLFVVARMDVAGGFTYRA